MYIHIYTYIHTDLRPPTCAHLCRPAPPLLHRPRGMLCTRHTCTLRALVGIPTSSSPPPRLVLFVRSGPSSLASIGVIVVICALVLVPVAQPTIPARHRLLVRAVAVDCVLRLRGSTRIPHHCVSTQSVAARSRASASRKLALQSSSPPTVHLLSFFVYEPRNPGKFSFLQ